ncbi:MAG: type II toxin-antitoxin system PemK/MazF family toxin [archaeon]
MKQKSVILTRFPFTNLRDYKIRPAVIVSNEKYNKSHSDFIICPITTKQTMADFEILIDKGNFSGYLEEISFIRTDVIATIDKELSIKEIGQISESLFEKLLIKLQKNWQ